MLLDPLRSLTDFEFYRTLPKKSIAATVGYLAFLGIIFAALYVLMFSLRYGPKVDQAIEWAAANIPSMTLSQGKLTSALTEPKRIEYPGLPQFAFIIDTNRTDPVSPYEMRASTVVAYITQNAAHYFTADGRLSVTDLSAVQTGEALTIDANFYRSAGAVLKKAQIPMTFIITWVVFMLSTHLAAFIYSLIALLLNAFLSAGLSYHDLYLAAVYAQTPVIVLQAIVMFLPKPVPFFPLLLLIVVTVYLWQALRHMKAGPAEPGAGETA
ncbi:MAG: DUF1189 family protein [Elusimicrobia bacterium]|nr:DUF1189 family protein [Elusimicrobiota bacterium]